MKSGVLLLTFCTVLAHNNDKLIPPRVKRGAVGALHIVTNHAQPIHADVKPENSPDATDKAPTEKLLVLSVSWESIAFGNFQPCSKGSAPAHIEPGVGFKVTAPEDAFTTYEIKSLRKSLPYTPPTTLDLIRSVSRIITLIILFVSAILEFFPTFHNLLCTIVSFVSAK